MNDGGDYSVRKPDGTHEVWGVGQVSDEASDAQARDRARKNAQRRKKKAQTPPEDEALAAEADDALEGDAGPDETNDDHTVDHLA